VAARTDPELRKQLTRVEPSSRASILKFAEAAFGDYAANPRFRHLMYTVMDTIRGILLMGLSDEDSTNTLKRWRRAKADFRELMNAVLTPAGLGHELNSQRSQKQHLPRSPS
jgi:hypothetical protein